MTKVYELSHFKITSSQPCSQSQILDRMERIDATRVFQVLCQILLVKALLHGEASIAILVSCNFLYHDPYQFAH
jgi:hypothetical protein